MIASGIPNFMEMYVRIFVITLLRRLLLNFQNSIRVHVRDIAFAALQIELYRVVDYDSKWSTKFHQDGMLESLKFHFQDAF